MSLPSDISRCAGTDAKVCQDCERRKQIERDDPSRWYPHMKPWEVGGKCGFLIDVIPGLNAEVSRRIR